MCYIHFVWVATTEETSKVIIAVIDTGYDFNNNNSKNVLPGVEIYKNPHGKIIVERGADDDVGHGTIVTNLIVSCAPNAKIFPVKIAKDGLLPKTDVLVYALQYLRENVPCDIINISAGITCCDDIESLYSICNKLRDKNIAIVSAYDNLDAVAYPAAFDCVIGVSGNIYYSRAVSYKYVDNSNSDFVCRNHQFYIKSINGQYETVSGNSFLAAEFSSRVARIRSAGIKSHEDIVAFLKEHAYGSIRTFSRAISRRKHVKVFLDDLEMFDCKAFEETNRTLFRKTFQASLCRRITVYIVSEFPIKSSEIKICARMVDCARNCHTIASSTWDVSDDVPFNNVAPWNAVDGNEDTFWNASANWHSGEWIKVTLPQRVFIRKVLIKERKGVKRIREYGVEVENEQGEWIEVLHYCGTLNDRAIIHEIPPSFSKNIRLVIYTTQKDFAGFDEPAIARFEIFN